VLQIDTESPSTAIRCGNGPCDGTVNSTPVSITLQATDTGGSGVASTVYTTDGSDPTTSPTATPYRGSFVVAGTTTVRVASTDNAGNTATVTARIPFSPLPGGLVLAPSDDTYTSRANPDGTHGSDASFNVNGGSRERRSFLAFDVGGIPANAFGLRATLWLYAQSGAPAVVTFTLSQTSSGWREAGLTWDDQPALGNTISTRNGLADGQSNNFDVTPAVHGNGRLAVALTTPDITQRYFSSKEAAARIERPKLNISWWVPR
jgi:hypothetical protein